VTPLFAKLVPKLTFISGGSHSAGESWKRTGHCGLGRAVSTLGLQTIDPIEIDFTVGDPIKHSMKMQLTFR
jgi:hypothetical protein